MKIGTLCYIKQDNQILMLHRVKKKNDLHQGLWVGLGGKVEPGESPEECIIREVYEESGLSIQQPRMRGILTFPCDGIDDDWYVFLFTATEFTGEMISSPEGDLQWINTDAFEALPMHEGDRLFLHWLDQNDGFLSAKCEYSYGKLIGHRFIEY